MVLRCGQQLMPIAVLLIATFSLIKIDEAKASALSSYSDLLSLIQPILLIKSFRATLSK
jgi:hypothetical protein